MNETSKQYCILLNGSSWLWDHALEIWKELKGLEILKSLDQVFCKILLTT